MRTNYNFSAWNLYSLYSLLVGLQYCRWCMIVLEYWNSVGPFYTTGSAVTRDEIQLSIVFQGWVIFAGVLSATP